MCNHFFAMVAGSEVEYLQQACNTMQMCLQFIAFVLRAALLSKIEEGERNSPSPDKHIGLTISLLCKCF